MIIRELLTKFGITVDKAKLDSWDKRIDRSKKKVVTLDKTYTKFVRKTNKKLGKGLAGLSHKMTRFNRRAEVQFAGILKPMRALANQIPLIGGMLGNITPLAMAAGVAIFGIVKAIQAVGAATRKFLDFEMGMKGIKRVTLSSVDDMKKLEAAALKAGEASIFTVTQAAEAEKFLAQAGLEVDQVIGALPGTLQLAAAAEMDLSRAAMTATDIMSAQSLGIQDLTRINDMLVSSARVATQGVEGFAAGFATLGNEAYLSGLSIETIGAALGILAKQGQKRELGGTLFRNLLAESKRKKFKKALKDIGIDLKDFMNSATGEFTDFEGFIQRLGKLNKADLFSFTQKGFAQASRGKRALLSLVNLSDLFSENLDKIEKSKGFAEQAAGVAFEGLSGQLALLKSKMEVAMISFMKDSGLAGIFEDIVAMAVNVLPSLIKNIGTLLSPILAVVRLFTIRIRGAAIIIGGMLKFVSSMAIKIINIFKTFLNPLGVIIERIFGGLVKIFSVASDVDSGPMSSWLDKFQALADGFDKWGLKLLKDINPFLEVIDILLNVFLLELPKAVDFFGKKLDEMAEKSFSGKVLKFFLGTSEEDRKEQAIRKREDKEAGMFGGLLNSVGSILGVGGNEAPGAPSDFKGSPAISGGFGGDTGIIPNDATGGIIPTSNSVSSSNKQISFSIGELKTEVVLPAGSSPDGAPMEIATEINDVISAQLRDLFREAQ